MSVRRTGDGGSEYRTAPHWNMLCLSAKCCPEKSSLRCVGGFYSRSGGLRNSLALIPPPNLIAVLWFPAAHVFVFFGDTNTIWQTASASSLGASGTSNTGIAVQILEQLLYEIRLHASSLPARSCRHTGDDVKHYQLHVWGRTANICTYNSCHAKKCSPKIQS